MQPISIPDRKYDTLDKVQAKLRAQGMEEPKKPSSNIPKVPKSLLAQGGDAVVELYRELEAWFGYVLYQLALSSLLAGEWKNDLTLLTKAMSANGMDSASIEVDERIIAVKRALQTQEQEEALWGVQKSTLDRRMKMVSRAVEVMRIDSDASRRASSVGNKPWPGC